MVASVGHGAAPMSATVTVYRTRMCPYCVAAAKLLERRGIVYEEIGLDGRPEERRALEERTHWRTVPQIFVGEHFVGGYTELAQIERSGRLDVLLGEDGA